MSDIAGITSSGFNYTAAYDPAATGSVEWVATFRVGDIYWGVGRGRSSQASALTQAELRWTVMADIEGPLLDVH